MKHHVVFTPASMLFIMLSIAGAPTRAALNDTGQTQCRDGSGLVACAGSTATENNGAYPRQDGRFGRDAAQTASGLDKIGGGAVGFDFTRICRSGEAEGEGSCVLAAMPVPGTGDNDWGCTRDNVTGLIWEAKQTSGMQNRNYTYAWYNGNVGSQGDTATCSGSLGGAQNCNTQNYVAAMNGIGLCGYTDWRLPTRRELLSIIHHGKSTAPAIDTDYFPNTRGSSLGNSAHWSSDIDVSTTDYTKVKAWGIYFYNGQTYNEKTTSFGDAYVRLVRGG